LRKRLGLGIIYKDKIDEINIIYFIINVDEAGGYV